MLEKLKKHLKTNFPQLDDVKFYVAVSGGIDSMVLVHLLRKSGYYFGMLHCNFYLRGKESDDDMKFFENYGDKFLIPYSVGHFLTKEYAEENKLSIQVAARELRYDWFYEQMNEKEIEFILTAHHLDDALETFIINLSRGTGIDGLKGIPQENEQILRPLLPFSRKEIEQYATENNIKWREDSSNESDKYLRNKIRQIVVPALKELNDDFLNSFQKTQNYLQETSQLAEDAVEKCKQKVSEFSEEGIYIDINKLKKYSNYKSYLYQILKEYNFKSWNDVYKLVDSQTGKKVFADDFVLLKNRNYLILSSKNDEQKIEEYFVEKNQKEVKIPLKIDFCNADDISLSNSNCIFVDENLLKFPLTIRKSENGDAFIPFGMNGKKKVSKFFKDEKFSMFDKENAWLLCSDDKVIWIINHRADERFRVTKNTKKIVKISTI